MVTGEISPNRDRYSKACVTDESSNALLVNVVGSYSLENTGLMPAPDLKDRIGGDKARCASDAAAWMGAATA